MRPCAVRIETLIKMDAASFEYAQLPDGPYIRLLAIHPAEHLRDPLTCDVHIVTLENAPSYAALSYTWGNPNPSHSLACDGRFLKIAYNLDRGLRRFRQLGTRKYIWADAVCINQSDNDEKNTQILLMQRIYRQAAMTYVYLGEQEDQPDTPNAVECVEKWIFRPARSLSESKIPMSTLISLLHQNRGRTADELLQEVLKTAAMPTRDDIAAWMAYQIFLTRPWFSRIWVVQEVTAAPERTLLQVGAFRITWNDLIAANTASKRLLLESDVNLGFSVLGGYRVSGKRLDALEAIASWKANRVNLETMDAIARSVHSGPWVKNMLPCEFEVATGSRSLSPVDISRYRADGAEIEFQKDSPATEESTSAGSSDRAPSESSEEAESDGESEEDADTDPTSESPSSGEEGDESGDSDDSDEGSDSETDKSEDSNPQQAKPGHPSRNPTSRQRRPAWPRILRKESAESLEGDQSETSNTHSTADISTKEAENDEWTDRLDRTARIRSLHLFQLLKRCCKFNATDKKDILYGLLGLASDAGRAPRPEYNKTSEEVFRQFAEYFVSQGYGTELLSMARGQAKPSWVPDFGAIGEDVPGHAGGWDHRHFSTLKAGGNGPGEVRLDGDKLVTKGYIIDDEIERLGPPLHSTEYFLRQAAGSTDYKRDLPNIKMYEKHIMDWDKATTAFVEEARNSGILGERSAAEMMRLYNVTISANSAEIHRHKSKSIVAEVGLGSYSTEIFGASSPSRRIRDHVIDTVQERRVAVTRGGLLCLVPEATEKGDLLCIVFGAPAPFVVRGDGDAVVLMGDAYVHEFMDGEAQQLCVEDIVIC